MAAGARIMIVTLHSHPVIWAIVMAPVGFGFGSVYFAALREGCARLLAGRRGALLLAGARLLATLTLMTLVAQRGAAALLALFGGFLLARSLAVRSASPAGWRRR